MEIFFSNDGNFMFRLFKDAERPSIFFQIECELTDRFMDIPLTVSDMERLEVILNKLRKQIENSNED